LIGIVNEFIGGVLPYIKDMAIRLQFFKKMFHISAKTR